MQEDTRDWVRLGYSLLLISDGFWRVGCTIPEVLKGKPRHCIGCSRLTLTILLCYPMFLSRPVPEHTPCAGAFFCLWKRREMMLRGDGQRESLLLLWTSLENAKREWNRMDPKYFRKDSHWASCTWNGSLERCWQGKWHLGNLRRNSKLVDTAVVNH